MIEVRQLTKRYGSKVAVDALTFDVRPRVVTGLLGPNGSGKSTTLRLILGLDAPDSGSATIGGRPYRGLLEDVPAVDLAGDGYRCSLAAAQAVGVGVPGQVHGRSVTGASEAGPGTTAGAWLRACQAWPLAALRASGQITHLGAVIAGARGSGESEGVSHWVQLF